MNKIIRDGKIAVLYSPGYGAGWFTWNSDHPELMFHPQLVEWAEKGLPEGIDLEDWCKQELDIDYVYTGGWDNIKITWLTQGTIFRINEYDGSESIEILNIDSNYFTA